MSLYDFAYDKFKGRTDVPNIYSMKPKNTVVPCEDKYPVVNKLLKVCYLDGVLQNEFTNALVDAYEDDNFLSYTCEKSDSVGHIQNDVACNEAKTIISSFDAVYLALTAQRNTGVKHLYENELLRLYREASVLLQTTDDLTSSVMLEDFIESNREYIEDVIAVRKEESR